MVALSRRSLSAVRTGVASRPASAHQRARSSEPAEAATGVAFAPGAGWARAPTALNRPAAVVSLTKSRRVFMGWKGSFRDDSPAVEPVDRQLLHRMKCHLIDDTSQRDGGA